MNLLRNAIGLAKSPAAAFAPPAQPMGGGGLGGMLKKAVAGVGPAMPAPTGPARMGGFLGGIGKMLPGLGGPGGGDAPPMPQLPDAPLPYQQQTDTSAAGGAPPQGDALMAALKGTGGGIGPVGGMPGKQAPPLEALMAALKGGNIGGGAGIGAPGGGLGNAVDAYGAPTRGLGGLAGGIKNVMSAPAMGAGIGRMTGRFR